MSLGISEMILNKTCELHWDLSLYLVENGKQIIRDSQVRIVFQLVVSIIDQKDMMCPDSRDIVLSDTFLEKLTNKPWLHVTQVRDEILARMTISGEGRPLRNPSAISNSSCTASSHQTHPEMMQDIPYHQSTLSSLKISGG